MEYGKYKYEAEKKARQAAKKFRPIELKNIRVSLGISQHDLALKAKKASEFLTEGHRVKIELRMKGREKYLDRAFIKERSERILNLLSVSYKVISEPKKGPRGITFTLTKA